MQHDKNNHKYVKKMAMFVLAQRFVEEIELALSG